MESSKDPFKGQAGGLSTEIGKGADGVAHLPEQQQAQDRVGRANSHHSLQDAMRLSESHENSTMPLLRCSFFDHARDNRPRNWVGTWDQLKQILARNYIPGTPGDKRTMAAISPAFYPQGVTRGRDTASAVGLMVLDFDNAREEIIPGEFHKDPRTGVHTTRPKTRKVRIDDPVSMSEAIAALTSAGVASIAWSTWSSTPDWEKLRVVIPLANAVPVDSWERASGLGLDSLGLGHLRRGLDLPVLRNPAALAFLAGSNDPSSIRHAGTSGVIFTLGWEALPAATPADFAPWQVELMKERQTQRERGDKWWNAYRVNGRPVDFQRLDLAAILEARGIKVGPPRPHKTGTKRRSCCPWAEEHSGGVDDDAAVLIHTPGTWPSFRCMHSGHAHMGLRDLLEWAWGRP